MAATKESFSSVEFFPLGSKVGTAVQRVGELADELAVGGLGPVWAMAVGVEFDVDSAQSAGEIAGEGSLARAGGADNDDAAQMAELGGWGEGRHAKPDLRPRPCSTQKSAGY